MNEDNGPSFNQRRNLQIKRELDAFEGDPVAKAQMQLDWSVQTLRDQQTIERASDRRGEYSPVKRFTEEMDDAQEWADQAYQRGPR
jgi:hypothetical protein